MSVMELKCQAPSCVYRTEPMEAALAVEMLKMHVALNHTSSESTGSIVKAEKVRRPTVKMEMGEDDFLFFIDRWDSYKRATGLTDAQQVRDQLLAACSDDLSRDLFRLVGTSLRELKEEDLLKKIKQLAVKPQNNLINVVKLLSLEQEREEPVRNYLARIKGFKHMQTDC